MAQLPERGVPLLARQRSVEDLGDRLAGALTPARNSVLSRSTTAFLCYKRSVSLFESLFEALNRGGVRYVVVGGVATVLHGYARLTVDVDLVVDLASAEAARAIDVLTALGLVPRVPVEAAEFADSTKRETWIRERNMRVFTMIDPGNPMRQVDLFVEPPMDFQELWARAEMVHLEHTDVRIASIQDLIAMKRNAGRPQDLADIEALEAILAKKRS